jgi:LacI family transcriptional regulator
MPNIRLKEVATAAGVSITTTSDALRGEARVRDATRKKVEAVAEKLGYRKHSAAATLSARSMRQHHKPASMAWLTVLDPDTQSMSAELARREAHSMGISFEHINLSNPKTIPHVIQKLDTRGCDGIVLADRFHPGFPGLQLHRFSVISTQESWFSYGVDVVRTNQYRTTLSLLKRVQLAGYRRIATCMREHDPIHPDDESRLGAAYYFQNALTDPVDRIPVLRLKLGDPGDPTRIAQWVEWHRPDVVVGFYTSELEHLTALGYKIPDQPAFVSLHVRQTERGRIGGCVHNKELIPSCAVRVLFEKIGRGLRGLSVLPKETIVFSPILAGASCPRLTGDCSQNVTKTGALMIPTPSD